MAPNRLQVGSMSASFALLAGGHASPGDAQPSAFRTEPAALAVAQGGLQADSSFERGLSGWRGWNARIVRRRSSAAPHGEWFAAATAVRGASRFGIVGRKAQWRVSGGSRYRASVAVRAADRHAVGKAVRLEVRHHSTVGRMVRRWTAVRQLARGFRTLSVGARPSRGGTLTIHVRTTDARSAGAFHVDRVRVRQVTAPSSGTAGPEGVRPFAPSSPFNTAIRKGAPLDPQSARKAAALVNAGRPAISYRSWSPAVYVGTRSDPLVEIRLRNQGRWGKNVLHGRKVRLPRGAAPPTDRSAPDNHMSIVFDGISHSLWQAETPKNGVLWAAWGGMARLSEIGRNLPNAQGGRGSGLNQIAGLITPGDLAAGEIRHALAVAVNADFVARGHVWPASRSDGSVAPGPTTVKEGQRLRLAPDVDLAGIVDEDPKTQVFARMIAKALRDYGAIVVDRGGESLSFYMVNPTSWTSVGARNPWPDLAGPTNASGSYNDVIRHTGIPWHRLQVIQEGRS